jgi:alpha-mannosidase
VHATLTAAQFFSYRSTYLFLGGITSSLPLFGLGRSDCRLPVQLSVARYVSETKPIGVTVHDYEAVRYLPGHPGSFMPEGPLFAVEGAPNVFLETMKRGEDDTFERTDNATAKCSAKTTIVLRLYEAFGGHAKAQLRIASHLHISKAYSTNLLEDDGGDELYLTRIEDGEEGRNVTAIRLDFHGFEVKTVKLVVAVHGRETVSEQG